MAEVLCGVCNTTPKKYKCPTCSLPYCSLPCFKLHKPTHPFSAPSPAPSQPQIEIPQPPPPTPLPKYLKKKIDFSTLATSPKFQEMLKAHPALLVALQKVYAATIEPEPEDARSRARGARGRGRGRGRGFGQRGGGRGYGSHGGDTHAEPRWTERKGDADGMRLLRKFREGDCAGDEEAAMREFGMLLEELYGEKAKKGNADEMEIA
ncbi:hypothetical protein P154DRAFT_542799 [Amniculicola lignicola CBS 123094]|uniref:HIT-type domain-containing protein n=1 Tax=Amniculicola lignicola CBS 123094 TaxID=1392246 RepID=A0A6A5WU41_9PLEO|nr:hypothetical protein P154DRAFT_542799 [Amniculicola lignicola CBS 123094]